MDIHKFYSFMDIHNSIMDIHNSCWYMDIHNSCWFMDIHNSIMDIYNSSIYEYP